MTAKWLRWLKILKFTDQKPYKTYCTMYLDGSLLKYLSVGGGLLTPVCVSQAAAS